MARTAISTAISTAAIAVLAAIAPSPAHAAPKVPRACGGYANLPGKDRALQAAGKVASITPRKGSELVSVVVADPGGDRTFELALSGVKLPFKVGDTIEASVRRGGGWHRVHDVQIKDATGKILIVISASGASDWADGWTVTTGKIVQSEQRSNTPQQSVRRTHALDFARGKTQRSTAPDKCTLLEDGADRYLVSGSGHSWLGERPPEGVDYQQFVMIRW
jgi:hypothetical protein